MRESTTTPFFLSALLQTVVTTYQYVLVLLLVSGVAHKSIYIYSSTQVCSDDEFLVDFFQHREKGVC